MKMRIILSILYYELPINIFAFITLSMEPNTYIAWIKTNKICQLDGGFACFYLLFL
jgi:hypothetical protein